MTIVNKVKKNSTRFHLKIYRYPENFAFHCFTQVNKYSLDDNEKKQFNFQIVPGLVIKLAEPSHLTACKKIIEKEKNHLLNCLLIDASLVNNYSFLGFNKNLESLKYFKQNNNNNNMSSLSQMWKANAESLIKDKIDNDLLQFCLINSILVFNNLTSDFLKQLIYAYKCKPLNFLEDISEENIFQIEEFRLIHNNYLNIKNSCTTILIETRIKSTLNLFQEYLKHCIKRVHNILSNSKYLLGNGQLEHYLYEELNKPNKAIDLLTTDNKDSMIYYNIVREAFKNTFRDMNLIIRKNTPEISDCTYDDFKSKTEAWKTACLINKFFLNTNLAIRL